jgi:purine nucleosidase
MLQEGAMAVKLLLDTDIGNDIDDAVALAYLLAQPECELLGVTTVSGHAVERAKLVSALCRAAGVDIPIYPGTGEPLLIGQRQAECQQAAALAGWEHETEFPEGQAVEFLRRTIRANPGEVTLLTIGPMTNTALLFKTDPEAACQLKALVMMGGVFTNQLPGVGPLEWNVICDPHAAEIVYRTPVAVHRSVGLDVTRQVTMDAKEVRARFSAPLLQPVLAFAEVWFKSREVLTFHDPLAAATIFDQDICLFERGTVDVELASERLKGYTFFTPGGVEGPHEVALAVNRARFFEHYFSVFE